METVHVQYVDGAEDMVQAVFSCPQDPDIYPYQDNLVSDDPRYIAFYESLSPQSRIGLVCPGD